MRNAREIAADRYTLMEQAPKNAKFHMFEAARHSDDLLGEGYAEEHPELLDQFLQASTIYFLASSIGVYMQDLRDAARDLP